MWGNWFCVKVDMYVGMSNALRGGIELTRVQRGGRLPRN